MMLEGPPLEPINVDLTGEDAGDFHCEGTAQCRHAVT